ncbi:hypothetical protein J8273_6364 [Carpediemonas membranifera]|uniref:Uncharacterized protein n=1 Tax=Carpediemonas membranifera TaxID=201153 RepID=A0A8J6DY61_9EUKA|nr:hypothetical protein J8273_6364 [Carpediemonas membranifera]|eukprot:KAG9391599.1 hypothetical protein J8273_6364 [Carpediemonas membranifera]
MNAEHKALVIEAYGWIRKHSFINVEQIPDMGQCFERWLKDITEDEFMRRLAVHFTFGNAVGKVFQLKELREHLYAATYAVAYSAGKTAESRRVEDHVEKQVESLISLTFIRPCFKAAGTIYYETNLHHTINAEATKFKFDHHMSSPPVPYEGTLPFGLWSKEGTGVPLTQEEIDTIAPYVDEDADGRSRGARKTAQLCHDVKMELRRGGKTRDDLARATDHARQRVCTVITVYKAINLVKSGPAGLKNTLEWSDSAHRRLCDPGLAMSELIDMRRHASLMRDEVRHAQRLANLKRYLGRVTTEPPQEVSLLLREPSKDQYRGWRGPAG